MGEQNPNAAEQYDAPPSGKDFGNLKNVVYVILFVVVLAFITLIIQYFSATQATFQDLKDEINQQSSKIDILYLQCSNNPQKIEVINTK